MKDNDVRQLYTIVSGQGKDKPCPVCGDSLEEEGIHSGCKRALRRTNRKGDKSLSFPYPTEHLDYWTHPKWHLPYY